MASLEQGDVAATNFAEFRTETSDEHDADWQFNWPEGTKRTVLSTDPETGATTFLLQLPPGYHRPEERARAQAGERRFEWHTCHEEIFFLKGEIWFGDNYCVRALGYLNHPPYWVHPADQHSESGATLLIKNSRRVDFEFGPIPQPWNGREYCQVERGSLEDDPNGITSLNLDGVPWRCENGIRVKELYHYRDGLRTELLRLPPNWRGEARPGLNREMLFVLSGALRVGDKELTEWGYCSGTGSQLATASTDTGATIIRWYR
ncbi:MAG TPA: hypothetical protein VIL54_11090 [Natronosporangium sp.]